MKTAQHFIPFFLDVAEAIPSVDPGFTGGNLLAGTVLEVTIE